MRITAADVTTMVLPQRLSSSASSSFRQQAEHYDAIIVDPRDKDPVELYRE